MSDQTMLPIPGSQRNAVNNAKRVGPSDPNEKIQLSIYARRNPNPPANLEAEVAKLSSELPGQRHYLNDADFTALYGASKEDLDAIAAWAAGNHLEVLSQDAASKRTVVEGSVGDISKALDIQLDEYEHPELGKYRGRSGKIYVPSKVYGLIQGIFGLDNRPVGKPRFRRRRSTAMALQPGVNPYAGCFFPTQVAQLYDYPAFDGTGQNVAIFAFNGPNKAQQGGYSLPALQAYFTTVLSQQTPQITDVVVLGPGNDPGPDTDASNKQGDATGEVMLDVCTVGSIVPAAHLFIYFSEFTSKGWVDILHSAIAGPNKISVISNSYGNPEQDVNSAWSRMAVSVVNQALEAAVARGITVFSAAGDDGSSDEGSGAPEVDFPASSPYVMGVGGTRLVASSGANPVIAGETVWNDLMQNEGAGGGGISVVFSKPGWQDGVDVPPSVIASHNIGRGVPDVSAVADPETSLVIVHVNGKGLDAVGGTSAAAPLWAALITRINQALGTSCGFLNELLYTKFSTGVLRDITQGNNGSYSAGPGWDACTGLGSPDGERLLAALTGAVSLKHYIHVNHVARLFPAAEATTAEAEKRFEPSIQHTPALPVIDWSAIGKQAPVPIPATGSELPAADAVVITWADAEWAALEHVFCTGNTAMPYSSGGNGSWPGWQKYTSDLPAHSDKTWTYWGYYRLVEMGSRKVLLFKSNTHLDWPGETILADLIERIISVVKPRLILSAGTAGGARIADHIGTINVVRAGTLYDASEPEKQWPDYSNSWEADWSVVGLPGFGQLLFAIPTVQSDLESLVSQFNQYYQTSYTLAQLDPNGLNFGDAQPALNNLKAAGTPLLTADSFLVATTAGNLDAFACVEMDDAIIAETCAAAKVAFGFVRNISDPVQNAALPSKVQGNWGEAVYSMYGFYTSYNGALATWAALDAQL